MVQTRLAKRKVEGSEGGSTPIDVSIAKTLGSSDEDDPVPKKRRRLQPRKAAKKTASKRRRGGKELCQLNLDVLFLIAEYIHPIDVLNLSRTCKSLRTLLMDKSSAFVWKTARGQVKHLPDCPSDLTEPEYANLVFSARCHGCGKYAQTIFWKMRLRYCPGCRFERFITYNSCNNIIRYDSVLAHENFTFGKEAENGYDKGQVNSFMDEYNKSSDKNQFLRDKRERYHAIELHASKCQGYQRLRVLERKHNLDERRSIRGRSIFERLKQCGYEAEIGYHGTYAIKNSYPTAFKTSKPLKDKDWESMLPNWLGIMNNLKERRLQNTVYNPRRTVLASEYKRFVQNPPDDLNPSYIIPDVVELANFPAFSSITRAPEESTHVNYASAFAQLPSIVGEWMQKVLTEFIDLIDFPLDSGPSKTASTSDQGESTSPAGLSPRDFGRLQLACALFRVNGAGVYTYSDALARPMTYPEYPRQTESEPTTGSTLGRLRISFVNEAPDIIRTCGLDPSVATADDMDQRNARLKCVLCRVHAVMPWRTALHHASTHHRWHTRRSGDWQLVSDEHISAIQAVENPSSVMDDFEDLYCLLCRRHVGSTRNLCSIMDHLVTDHKLDGAGIQAGVHYAPLDIRYANGVCSPKAVFMVEKEGDVTFHSNHKCL